MLPRVSRGIQMETITVTETTGRKIRIPREAVWRLEGNSVFVPGPREPHRTSITFHRFPRLRTGIFMRYMAFLEEVRRMATDLDKRLSCSIDVQESYQELRDLISNQSEANYNRISRFPLLDSSRFQTGLLGEGTARCETMEPSGWLGPHCR